MRETVMRKIWILFCALFICLMCGCSQQAADGTDSEATDEGKIYGRSRISMSMIRMKSCTTTRLIQS